MIPLVLESQSDEVTNSYLEEHYYLQNLVHEIRPENDSIGLPAVKFLIDRAKFSSPAKSQAVYLIHSGHLITPIAQNALLKTLEESRPEEQFILTTHNHHLLLDTILSRCRLIALASPPTQTLEPAPLPQLVAVLTSTPADCLTLSDTILADSPKEKLADIITALRLANRHLPTPKRLKILALALTTLSDLERNINPKLALDHFLLKSSRLVKQRT